MSRSKPRIARRFRGMTLPTKSHPHIRRIQRQGVAPSIHGDKLWDASALLIDYLSKHPPEHSGKVIDVGCGWGPAGIWCAKALGSEVTSVDADPNVFPYLEATAALNKVETRHLVKRFEQLSTKALMEYDILLAADVCFWDELVNPVYNLINRAVNAGVKHILVADPERSTFLEMAERAMNKHCADLLQWQTRGSINARGAILVIENA